MNIARKRLTRKLVTLFVAPLAIAMITFGLFTIHVWRQALLEDARRSLVDHAATLRAMTIAARGADPAALAEAVEQISATETVDGVALYDRAGAPIARSALLAASPEAADAAARRAIDLGGALDDGALGPARALVHAERVDGAPGVGALVIAHSLDPIDRMIDRAAKRLAIGGGALALIVAALSLWAARGLGRGLGGLVVATERVAGGDLDVAPPEGPAFLEFPRVARAFGEMTAALAEARERLDRAGAERRELERRVLHAQGLAVVGQVSSAFAHEIGSPLNTILGWARLSASDASLSPEVRGQFETIAGQCDRIARMVQRVLSVSRPHREEKTLLALAGVVREAAAFLGPDLRARRVDLRLDLDPGAPRVFAVRDLLLQILINLCLNAADAQADRGGLIRVTVAADEEDPDDPRVRLQVADAGPGVPEDLRARIFEPFYSTKAEGRGTGLGLAVVADIVRDLGGRVSVDSAPEGGALFTVTLPAGAPG